MRHIYLLAAVLAFLTAGIETAAMLGFRPPMEHSPIKLVFSFVAVGWLALRLRFEEPHS